MSEKIASENIKSFEKRQKDLVVLFFNIFGIIMSIVMSIIVFFEHRILLHFNVFLFVFLIVSLILNLIFKMKKIAGHLSIIGLSVLFCSFLVIAGPQEPNVLWFNTLPIIYMFTVGKKHGIIYSVLGFLSAVFILFFLHYFDGVVRFSNPFNTRVAITYIFVFVLSYIYETMRYNANNEVIKKNIQLQELTLLDPLTKLKNRRYFKEIIISSVDSFIKSKIRIQANNNCDQRDQNINDKVYGFFIIDIDFFKKVNDTYGHAAGDIVLQVLSDVLQKSIRTDDTILRWGGEEFLIILSKTRQNYIPIFCQKILDLFRNTEITLDEKITLNVTCSIGCSSYPLFPEYLNFNSIDKIISICDQGLYKAKNNGRDRAYYIEADSNISDEDKISLMNQFNENCDINSQIVRTNLIHQFNNEVHIL